MSSGAVRPIASAQALATFASGHLSNAVPTCIIRRFQLYLAETGTSICNRNRIMTGLGQKCFQLAMGRTGACIVRHSFSFAIDSPGVFCHARDFDEIMVC